MKILVVGSGGREHALVWKLSQSKRVKKIFALPGSSAIGELAELVDISSSNIIEIADFAQKEGVDLTVVGPELPLSLGIVDEFIRRNLKIFGPSQKAAMLESSKAFSKDFMKKAKIPTAEYNVFNSAIEAVGYLRSAEFPVVIKTDGLAGGKGVFICRDLESAENSIRTIMLENRFGKAGDKIVVEEFLEGKEMSFMVVADGKRALPMATSMDYKKVGDGDNGPNTGGMGAISPSPLISEDLFNEVMQDIVYPTLEAMRQDGREFRGLLYVGLMIVNNKPKVLEYNVRFGDPETQTIMMRLKSDLVDLLESAADGNIYDVPVEWEEAVAGGIVLASHGYPESYETGKIIDGLKRAKALGVEIFHAGTEFKDNKYHTAGGRVMNVCALGSGLAEVMKKVYDAAEFIDFENKYFRKDIGRIKE